MDLNKNRYENFNELYTYCYRVAGVVGLIMLKIFGSHYKEAEKYAVDLGIAMQLTNILRDIKEDFERGRIYLPGDEMERFGVSKDFIAGNKMNSDFIALLQFQIARARQYYQRSAKGIKMINNVLSRLVVCMMMEMYAGILNVIEENDYDVFSQRAHVTTAGKLGIAIKILFKGYYL
jgi:phytoene synthase